MAGQFQLSIGVSNIGQIRVRVENGEVSISLEPASDERS
jgi:hypothetical protein